MPPGDPMPTSGAGRWVSVAPERLERWLAGFAERHGAAGYTVEPARVVVAGADGATATCEVPFPPLAVDPQAAFGGLVAHACAERSVGVLLVRLGGHAAGTFQGTRLVASKVGSRPVHGRSAAGGWSQHRFSRRREGQARVALEAAADAACGVLLPALTTLAAVVTGGDHDAAERVLGDPRLTGLRALTVGAWLDVPTPNRRVLLGAPALYRAVRIRIHDPT